MSQHPKARIILLLHAHIPYVRLPDQRFPLQELWLYQNLSECYIPLIRELSALLKDPIDFSLSISLSPTLLCMVEDDYYLKKFTDYCGIMLRLCKKESLRAKPHLSVPVSHIENHITSVLTWWESCGGNFVDQLRHLSGDARINLLTTCATHGLLPALRHRRTMVKSQIDIGLQVFSRNFGYIPQGFWLPEMGYYTGLDGILRESGIQYTFCDSHGAYGLYSTPEHSTFLPLKTPSGLTVFPRDVKLSDAIWSKTGGYPGDYRYREFHADYCFELPDKELAEEKVDRLPLGLKLKKITGRDVPRKSYDPVEGALTARIHAGNFMERVIHRAVKVTSITDHSPVFTLPFDAELFGHWWHEGIIFLIEFIRLAASSPGVELISPEEHGGNDVQMVASISEASWGRGGYFSTWLNPECLRRYERITRLHDRLQSLGNAGTAGASAIRELLLAQASDWPFFISWDTFRDYGISRLDEHIAAAEKIIEQIEAGRTDASYIKARNTLYPLFTAVLPVSRI